MSDACIDHDLTAAARRAAEAIMQAKLKTVTAESCTAGLIAAALSEVPGASCFLEAGFVVYAKSSKTRLLGVDEKLIHEKTSVSSEVAEQMARQCALQESRPGRSDSCTLQTPIVPRTPIDCATA